ncbi:MAG: Smr/MutS family protein, partial [Candidatus Promineifilaceae bacterium]
KLKKLQKQTEAIQDTELDDLVSEIVDVDEQPIKRKKITGPAQLQPGDKIKVISLGAKGTIASLDKKIAEVNVGRLHMRIRLEDIQFLERPEEENDTPSSEDPADYKSKIDAESPGMELDIRGLRVEEGINALDQYLDAAFLANLPWVRIIHGKGTGRLRSAVRDSLSKNTHVTSWEEGRDGEGGAGVTVAKLDVE